MYKYMKIQGPQFQRDYVIAWKFLGGGGGGSSKTPLERKILGGGGVQIKESSMGGGGFFFLTTEVFTCSKLINAFKR